MQNRLYDSQVISTLRGHDDKVRVVLNKADQVDQLQLMRVYGALMWSLGKVFKSPEVWQLQILLRYTTASAMVVGKQDWQALLISCSALLSHFDSLCDRLSRLSHRLSKHNSNALTACTIAEALLTSSPLSVAMC